MHDPDTNEVTIYYQPASEIVDFNTDIELLNTMDVFAVLYVQNPSQVFTISPGPFCHLVFLLSFFPSNLGGLGKVGGLLGIGEIGKF